MSIALIGYRGSGKTTTGRKLADRLWQSFVDTDELIVGRAGKDIRHIFDERGEAGFRDLEMAVVAEVSRLQDHVIALGGGAVLREENRRALRSGDLKVVYLRCDPEELARRIHADPATASTRPSLTALGGGVDEVRKMLAERESLYRSVMTVELDVTHLSTEHAVERVAGLI